MKARWKLVLILAVLACAAIGIVIFGPSGRDGGSNRNCEIVRLPDIFSGSSTGYAGQVLNYTIGGGNSSEGYGIKYCIDWGDGSYSETNFIDSEPVTISHIWNSPGTYDVKVMAIGNSGIFSAWSAPKKVTISNLTSSPFLIANTPSGPSTGEINETLSYSTSASSNIGGSPEYRFDWGDGSYSGWSFSSNASHSWSSAGTYTIKAQAKLPSITSEWSTGRVVVIEEQTLSRQPYPSCQQMKRYITPNDQAIEAALQEILRQPGGFTAFETLRTWVASHVSYKHDVDVHGLSEYWQLPSETLELRTGDCEDFAILLCSLLRAYEVAADQVYVGVGFDENNNGHAYLVERYYEGVWRVTEPQADAWSGWFFRDWLTEVSFKTFYCFNDQYCFAGAPTLPSGVYEFQLSFIGGSSVVFERYMSSGQTMAASVEWLPRHGQLPDFSIFGWGFRIYNASGNVVFSWFGGDLRRSFSFAVGASGRYKVEVYMGGFLPSSARLTMDPPDWSRQ